MITILASYAQEESFSASENQKWRIRKNFQEGKPWDATILGYRYKNGRYEIEPNEAAIVRKIYDLYLGGKGLQAITNMLNEEGAATRFGRTWHISTVRQILSNPTYTGDLSSRNPIHASGFGTTDSAGRLSAANAARHLDRRYGIVRMRTGGRCGSVAINTSRVRQPIPPRRKGRLLTAGSANRAVRPI